MNQLFMNLKLALFCLLLAGYGLSFAQETPPQKVNFQGRLTDLSDNPLNGNYTLTFSLYAEVEGGTALWTETQPDVTVTNGAVEAVLGSVTAIPWSAARVPGVYLEIQVGSEVLSPRQPFNSVLYAMNAAQLAGKTYDLFVDTITTQTISGIKIFSANPIFNDDAIPQIKVRGLTTAFTAVAVDTTTLKGQIDAKQPASANLTYLAGNDGSHLTNVMASIIPANISVSTINSAASYGGINITSNIFVNGKIGIGTTGTIGLLHVQGTATLGTDSPINAFFETIGSDNGGDIHTATARGTPAAKTVVLPGDGALNLNAVGYDGNDYNDVARIQMVVDGTPSLGRVPGRIDFETTGLTGEDAFRMVIKNDGKVGIGTRTPSASLHVQELAVEGSVGAAVMVESISNGDAYSGPHFVGAMARGVATLPTIVADGDRLLDIAVVGHDGGTYRNAASIEIYVDGTPAAGKIPTRMDFVTADAAGVVETRMSIKPNGSVGIGTMNPVYPFVVSSGAAAMFYVAGDGAHATKYYGDGSSLTGIAGDSLGNHTATTGLNMANFPINNVSSLTVTGAITAARYQIAGSNVLAVLPGEYSIAVGLEAGSVNTASGSTFVGYAAGAQNTTGISNTFMGAMAGEATTIGELNTFLGSSAGWLNTIGGNNTFVGASAGQYNISGNYNTFVGGGAGAHNNTGEYNSFFGFGAGTANTTGTANAFLGAAGNSNTTGSYNTLVGVSAGDGNQTGSANAILGTFAGAGVFQTSFSSSTIMGFRAGERLNTGSDNLLLGFQVGDSLTTGNRNIIIGYDQDAPTAATSNHLNIGGVIYGDLSTGKVGVGTASPGAKLEVAGDVKITGGSPGAGKVLTSDAFGLASWQAVSGDNLGNHTATNQLNMGNYPILNVSSVSAMYFTGNGSGLTNLPGDNLGNHTATMALNMGGYPISSVASLTVSSNVTAAKYYGDGSSLTGIAGDNLGNHTASADLNMSGRNIVSVGTVTAAHFVGDASGLTGVPGDGLGNHVATTWLNMSNHSILNVGSLMGGSINGTRFEINGSTALAVLPGSGSLGVGVNAGRVTTGNYNSFLGADAGYSNTTGANNAFVGSQAGFYNTLGHDNSFVGFLAGFSNTDGSSNSFFGEGTGYNNTSGSNNSFFGLYAGNANTIGTSNSLVGMYAGNYNQTGSANAIFGSEAGGYNGGSGSGSFSSSAIMGYRAGNKLTNGSGNIFVGYQAGYSVTTGSGNIIIGYAQDAPNATTGNFLNIGGAIYGDLATGKVGIGTMFPTAKLNIVSPRGSLYDGFRLTSTEGGGQSYGASIAVDDSLKIGDATHSRDNIIISTTGNIALAPTTGRVGIGVVDPNNTLQVAELINFDNTVYNTMLGFWAGHQTTGGWNTFVGHQAGSANVGGTNNTALGKNALYSNVAGGNNTVVGYAALDQNTGGSRNAVLGTYAGNGQSGANFSDNTLLGYAAGQVLTTGGNNVLIGSMAGDNLTTGTGNIIIGYNKDAPADITSNHLNIGGVIYGNLAAGYIGIGTASPDARLTIQDGDIHLASSTYDHGIRFADGSYQTTAAAPDNTKVAKTGDTMTGALTLSGSSLTITGAAGISVSSDVSLGNLIYTRNGRVGIGFNNPQVPLHVTGNLELARLDSSGVSGYLQFLYSGSPKGNIGYTGNMSFFSTPSPAIVGAMIIQANDGIQLGVGSEAALNITNKNVVGIGTSDPGAKLDIVSTGTTINDYAQIWRDSNGTIVSSVSATGVMMAAKFVGAGDNLGNHIATTNLNIAGFRIDNVNTLTAAGDITAAGYQIAGSTVLAVLPGTGSLGVGLAAGRVNTGDYNAYLGYQAGFANVTGQLNSFVGYRAGYGNTSGQANSFVGTSAGYSNTTGEYNSFVGYSAGWSNTTGSNNTIVGRGAGYNTQTGSANAIFGDWAGLGTSGSFSSSTLMGYQAGFGLTTGSDNILLGFKAGDSLTTGSGNIIIGYDQDAPAAGTNSFLNIGGAIYGDLAKGNVGVGTANPSARLHVVSNSTTDSAIFIASHTTWGYGMVISTMAQVGIGTANPASILDLAFAGSNGIRVNSTNGSAPSVKLFQSGAEKTTFHANSGDSYLGTADAANMHLITNGTSKLTVLSGGNVGVGTASPSYRLVVSSGAGESGVLLAISTGSTHMITMTGNGAVYANKFYGDGSALTGISVGDNLGNHTATQNLNMSANDIVGVSTISVSSITSAGGSVTLSADFYMAGGELYSSKLAGSGTRCIHVNNSGQVGLSTLSGECGTSGATGDNLGDYIMVQNLIAGNYWLSGDGENEGIRITNAGKVGVGTATPAYRLVVSSGAGESGVLLAVSTGTTDVITMTGNGAIYASKFYGDGSALTGISSGDNLGNHTATQPLNMSYLPINNVSTLTVNNGITVSGSAQIAKYTVQSADAGVVLSTADFGKTITVNSSSLQTVTLPSVSAGDIGAQFTIIKLGAGQVTIQAAGGIYIADSTSGGTVYNDTAAETYASITLRLATGTKWIMVGGDGSWTTN